MMQPIREVGHPHEDSWDKEIHLGEGVATTTSMDSVVRLTVEEGLFDSYKSILTITVLNPDLSDNRIRIVIPTNVIYRLDDAVVHYNGGEGS